MKYKIGDKVRIKSWEQMEGEYGLDSAGHINILYSFTDDMRPYCNEILTIDEVDDDSYRMASVEWIFTDKMIKGVVQKNQKSMWIEVTNQDAPYWDVYLKSCNGKHTLASIASWLRKIDAMRLAQSIAKQTGLEIRVKGNK